MTQSNFNWFLHVMLFYHTRYVLERQKGMIGRNESEDDEDILEEE